MPQTHDFFVLFVVCSLHSVVVVLQLYTTVSLKAPHQLLSIHQVNISCQSPALWIREQDSVFGPQTQNETLELSLTGSCGSRIRIHLWLADLIG